MSAKRHMVYLRFPASEEREVPEGMMTVAERRTEHLHRHVVHKTVKALLADAYMQGINDAFAVAETASGRAALLEQKP